ncbi:MAG: cell envelope integrity protein CreD [Rhodospirillaceae bacterium]|nr:cell envelope integrity protein CreD [Rhodospirillaceae bacterium]
MAWSPTGAAFSGRNPILKVLLILGLVIGLLLPLMLVDGLVSERQSRYREVVQEIGNLWGRQQVIAGPILVVPARHRFVDNEGEVRVEDDSIILLPDDYDIVGHVAPETRRRGIFEAVVYRLEVEITGTFVLPAAPDWLDGTVTVDWSRARLALGLSDQRSITSAPDLQWNGQGLPMTPGLPPTATSLSWGGMQAALPALQDGDFGTPLAFSVALSVNGSQSLSFLPLGRNTTAAIASSWPHPSFDGSFLPDTHEVREDGFDAHWATSYFARSYPQGWRTGEAGSARFSEINNSAFGVRFYQPVDAYQQTERSAKYGILFIVFTFTVFFLYEMVAGLRIHIFQYGLVGCSLSLFYLLLLAFSEQIGFGPAYAAGAAAVVAQIAFYTHAVLGSAKRTALLAALLAALYAGLYVLMQTEDLALLIGAVALFAGLTAVMAVTRRVDWYALGAGVPKPPVPAAAEPPQEP